MTGKDLNLENSVYPADYIFTGEPQPLQHLGERIIKIYEQEIARQLCFKYLKDQEMTPKMVEAIKKDKSGEKRKELIMNIVNTAPEILDRKRLEVIYTALGVAIYPTLDHYVFSVN
jgi:hypothetical protein